ncbi:MAG: hypothetical protein B6229_04885 [Spirochaetaceae bacterium 4572_7]|nr:MAG: hypothetical protein B6229_04885 [Spirochaetaceae bacterium 4572_7]
MDLTCFYDLKDNMCDQVDIFEEILEVNQRFKDSIIKKDWDSINKSIDELNELSVDVHRLDSERVNYLIEVANELHSKESENFYTLIKKAPHDIRDELVKSYYKLKSSVIRVQGVYKGLNEFIEYKKDISKEIIDVLMSDAKGNVYTKPGRRGNDSPGFLIDRQL